MLLDYRGKYMMSDLYAVMTAAVEEKLVFDLTVCNNYQHLTSG